MWEFNFNEITPEIFLGSCPMNTQDLELLVNETGITAVLSVQADDDLKYYQINIGQIMNKAKELGVKFTRCPMTDFDLDDQKLKLIDAVKAMASFMADGHKVYVHCSAGINRSSLTVLGYLCFVKKMDFEKAYKLLKTKRRIVEPYIDVFNFVKDKLGVN